MLARSACAARTPNVARLARSGSAGSRPDAKRSCSVPIGGCPNWSAADVEPLDRDGRAPRQRLFGGRPRAADDDVGARRRDELQRPVVGARPEERALRVRAVEREAHELLGSARPVRAGRECVAGEREQTLRAHSVLGHPLAAERAERERRLSGGEPREAALAGVERIAGAQELERAAHATVDMYRQDEDGRGPRSLGRATDRGRDALQVRLLVLRKLADGEAGAGELGRERLRRRGHPECRRPPVDVGAGDRDIRRDGAGSAVGDDLERLGERAGGGQGQPCGRKGVELPLNL
ncbi:MAG: hypothetical protein AUG91_01640 [Actinobacteria bacterium 13_1_20CM_4_69_9]|nr:MAG: hypothetical protein AUG91_01640 [Actinobacteria bacterium 13_1_20CM_4_69_9]